MVVKGDGGVRKVYVTAGGNDAHAELDGRAAVAGKLVALSVRTTLDVGRELRSNVRKGRRATRRLIGRGMRDDLAHGRVLQANSALGKRVV